MPNYDATLDKQTRRQWISFPSSEEGLSRRSNKCIATSSNRRDWGRQTPLSLKDSSDLPALRRF